MNSTFATTVWGIYPDDKAYVDNHWFARRAKIDGDIKLFKLNPYSPPLVIYVFGSDNYRRLTDLGFNCRLLDRKPFVLDMEKQQYGMKCMAWQAGAAEYDSISFIDFDCLPLKPIPSDYWKVMDTGTSIKATIYIYHLRRVNRPPDDYRKVCSATHVYFRGRKMADGVMNTWVDMGKPWKGDEYALTKYIDSLDGGWKGVEGYKKYDIPYQQMSKVPGLEKNPEQLVFGHFNHHVISTLIGDGNNVKSRIDKLAKEIFI